MRTGFDAVNAAIKQTDRKRHGPSGTTRIYTLFPKGFGGFSAQTIDYHGTLLRVAATSIRQAYAVAHKNVWINPADQRPVGIVSVYRSDTGTTLWCGCSGHSVTGGRVEHGAGIRVLRAAIEAHNSHCPYRRLPLADRLRRHVEVAKPQEEVDR